MTILMVHQEQYFAMLHGGAMLKKDKNWAPPKQWRLYLMGCFLVIASAFDAWMTLEFIAAGGEEANPYVIPMIQLGTAPFLIWKLIIGIFTSMILVFACQRKRWAWWGFNLVIWTYLLLTALHFYIILQVR